MYFLTIYLCESPLINKILHVLLYDLISIILYNF